MCSCMDNSPSNIEKSIVTFSVVLDRVWILAQIVYYKGWGSVWNVYFIELGYRGSVLKGVYSGADAERGHGPQ